MAGYWVQVLAVVIITSQQSFGNGNFQEAGRSPQKNFQYEYPLYQEDVHDTEARETVDGSYSVVQPANSQGIHADERFRIAYEAPPDRAPIFQQESEKMHNIPINQESSPVFESRKTEDNVGAHQTGIIGHQLLGDQHTLQELLTKSEPESVDGNQQINTKKVIADKEGTSNKESTTPDHKLPTAADSPSITKQDTKKATILPVLLKPFYTILQPDTRVGIPGTPLLLNTRTKLDTFQISPSSLLMDIRRPQNDNIGVSQTTYMKDQMVEQINCDPVAAGSSVESDTRMTNAAGKSLSMSRHQPTAGKSYELAPSALPLVGGLPHDSAHLQILSENPHHIFIHPPKVFPVTPSPEQSGPLLGGPPHKPRTTTQATPSSTPQTYQGNKRPMSGRSLFFDNKPEQNLQTLQQQMYPTRARLEPLTNVQPVQQYVLQHRPTSRFAMQYPVAQQSNQEQLFLMMQRRYIQNYNNQDMLTYMQPVAVLVMPSNPKTKQN